VPLALLVVGLAMIVAVVTDVVATTTAISAAGGWLTRRVNRVSWADVDAASTVNPCARASRKTACRS
jgi:hypothetical protein